MVILLTLIVSCLFACYHTSRHTIPAPLIDKVHLSLIESLAFQSDRNVTRKDGSSAYEMECVATEGGRRDIKACYPRLDTEPLLASFFHPSVVICHNDGYDTEKRQYRWNCSVESSYYALERQLVDTEVLCDGVHHAHDPVVLHSTCRLRYQLLPPPPTIKAYSTAPVDGTTCQGTVECRRYAHIPPCPLPASCGGHCGHQCMEYAMDWETLTMMGRVRDHKNGDDKTTPVGYYTIDIPWDGPTTVPKQDEKKGEAWGLDRINMAEIEQDTQKYIDEDEEINVIVEPISGGGSRLLYQMPSALWKTSYVDIEVIVNNPNKTNTTNDANKTQDQPQNHSTNNSGFILRHYFPDYWLKQNLTADDSVTATVSDTDAIFFCVYQFLSTIWSLLRFIPLIIVRVVVIIMKLFMTLMVGFFTGHPTGSIFTFIANLRDDLFGGLGAALLDFIIILFRGTIGTMLMFIGCALFFMLVFMLCSGLWACWKSFDNWYYGRVYHSCKKRGDSGGRNQNKNKAPILPSKAGATSCSRVQLDLPEETLIKRDQVVALLYAMVQSLEPDVVLSTHNDSDAERCLDYLDARQTRFVTSDQPTGSCHEQDGQWFFCTKNNNGASLFTEEAYRFVHHVLRCQSTQELERSRAVTGALVESFCKPLVLPLSPLPGSKKYGLIINPRASTQSLGMDVVTVNDNSDVVRENLLTIAPIDKCNTDGVACGAVTLCDITFAWVKDSSTVTLIIVDVMYVFRLETKSAKIELLSALFDNDSTHQYVLHYKLKFQSILDRLTV